MPASTVELEALVAKARQALAGEGGREITFNGAHRTSGTACPAMGADVVTAGEE